MMHEGLPLAIDDTVSVQLQNHVVGAGLHCMGLLLLPSAQMRSLWTNSVFHRLYLLPGVAIHMQATELLYFAFACPI